MFTGIVEETGTISKVKSAGNSARLTVTCKKVLDDTKIGDSIAVNGVCLTVIRMDSASFDADISFETLKRSSLAHASAGTIVNLERALTLSTRLGGHLVSGHVDGVGTFVSLRKMDDAYLLGVRYPAELDKYIAEKGSITIDGISLTVTKAENGVLEVAVIPHTYNETVLKNRRSGDMVNLEVDVIARYIEKLLKNETKGAKLGGFLNELHNLGEGF